MALFQTAILIQGIRNDSDILDKMVGKNQLRNDLPENIRTRVINYLHGEGLKPKQIQSIYQLTEKQAELYQQFMGLENTIQTNFLKNIAGF
jgi:hypothetical protein